MNASEPKRECDCHKRTVAPDRTSSFLGKLTMGIVCSVIIALMMNLLVIKKSIAFFCLCLYFVLGGAQSHFPPLKREDIERHKRTTIDAAKKVEQGVVVRIHPR